MTSSRSAFVLFALCTLMALQVDWHPTAVSAPWFDPGNRDAVALHYPPPLALVHAVLAVWIASTVNLALALTIARFASGSRLDRARQAPLAGLGLAVLLVLIANGAVRACDVAARPRFLPDAELQWRPAPYAEMAPGIVANARGLRADDLGMRRPDVRRVLVLGDSAVWGASPGNGAPPPVPFAQRLQGVARARGVEVEVINAAVVGYSSLQGRRMLPELIDAYQPDILVFGYNNDSLPNGGVPDRQRTAESAWVRACQTWLYRCDLYLLLRQRLMGRIAAREGSAPVLERVPLAEHVENYKAFIETARASGAVPHVLILPSLHVEGFDEADRALARETDTPLLDMHALAKRAGRPLSELVPDGLHPTEAGHAILAEMLFEEVFPTAAR